MSFVFSNKVACDEEFFTAIKDYLVEHPIELEYIEFEDASRIYRVPVSDIDKLESMDEDLFLAIDPLKDQVLQFEMSSKLEADLAEVNWKSASLILPSLQTSETRTIPSYMDWVEKLPPELREVFDLNDEKMRNVHEMMGWVSEETHRLAELHKELVRSLDVYIKLNNVLHDVIS